MIKRTIVFGDYDTAAHGWTLTGCKLGPATQKTNFVDKPGGDGSWDLSTTLTDGLPRYSDRPLTATFECSEGNRTSREDTIRQMVNQLDGMRLNIKLPDDSDHYIVGRLHVARDYNDLAHAAVTVTATCEPWRYAYKEKIITQSVSPEAQTITLVNNGRRAVVPTLIANTTGSMTLNYGDVSRVITSAGTYRLPDLILVPGSLDITYNGAGGIITLRYREAVLE